MVVGFFFFQAEDGIRDRLVTGVQTCALPILAALAHKFKASIDFVGARNLKKVVNEIEKNAKDGNVGLITSLVASANSIWNEVLIELQSELSTIKSE